jgi:hypothetical protein
MFFQRSQYFLIMYLSFISSALALTPTPISTAGTLTPGSIRTTQIKNGADLAVSGKMKDHFRAGMKLFMKDKWDAAIPELIASTMIVDPFTWNYWYAEAYATLGVIYEFHSKDPQRNALAYKYYKLALKHDPLTKSARYYIDSVKPAFVTTSK